MPDTNEPRPFLKWAGGKRQLLPHLRRFYPVSFRRYFEPFLGSGAVFFDLAATGRLSQAGARLSDANAELIGSYLRVRDNTDAVIAHLQRLAAAHCRCGPTHYYDVRDRQFNPRRNAWRNASAKADDYPVALAAMLLYLNRTGYNGLFRLNAAGGFNVPAGRYEHPHIVNEERLRAAAAWLRRNDVTIEQASFEHSVRDVEKGDFVYFDPPYAPLTATANFRSYTARGFNQADQIALRDLVITLAERGAHVLVSNSTATEILKIYEHRAARRAGLQCVRVPARRAINSRGDRRGVVEELVVSTVTRR